MKNATKKIIKKQFSKKEIEKTFKELGYAEKVFTPLPIPDNQNTVSERWIVIGGSSKENNKLIKVSTWQTGQIY